MGILNHDDTDYILRVKKFALSNLSELKIYINIYIG